MIYYSLKFDEKDKAKTLGARFDFDKKLWCARTEAVALKMDSHFKRVDGERAANLKPITELVGEDRNFGGNGLIVDLIPASCFFKNVRSSIHEMDWRVLSMGIRARANNTCEICGFKEDRQEQKFLEAHERWHYDEATHIQKLMRIVCLCNACHTYTHMGLAQITGKDDMAIKHKMKVSGLTRTQVKKEIEQAFKEWEARNRVEWALDLGIIVGSGIRLNTLI
jgi:hypothetical protein